MDHRVIENVAETFFICTCLLLCQFIKLISTFFIASIIITYMYVHIIYTVCVCVSIQISYCKEDCEVSGTFIFPGTYILFGLVQCVCVCVCVCVWQLWAEFVLCYMHICT